MQQYKLDVSYRKAGRDCRIIILTHALSDDEALRAAHPVADMAEWESADDIRISITTSDGREIGFVGDTDGNPDYLDRPERRAATYRSSANSD